MTLHPLYAFSISCTVGIAAQTARFIMVLTSMSIAHVVFDRVARIEEIDMIGRFENIYSSYLARTLRFLPQLSLWRLANGNAVDYSIMIRTFCDFSLFLLAVPLSVAVRWAHDLSVIPVLYKLP
jgi:hypothetical protein